jgi:hypothetical protein
MAIMAPPISMGLRFLAIAIVSVLGATACQNSSATPVADAAPVFDAAIGVMCSNSLCTPQTGCCTGTGGPPACLQAGQTCSGKLVKCDGPEDCSGGTSCCFDATGGSTCTTADTCTGSILCTTDSDCPSSEPSCCNHECATKCSQW